VERYHLAALEDTLYRKGLAVLSLKGSVFVSVHSSKLLASVLSGPESFLEPSHPLNNRIMIKVVPQKCKAESLVCSKPKCLLTIFCLR
jgi:hypothetical protein